MREQFSLDGFLPRRLGDAPSEGSLAQFLQVNGHSKKAGPATSRTKFTFHTRLPVSIEPTGLCE
jgi:hypothetical protein